MHYLVGRVAIYLSHHRLISTNPVGDAIGKMKLILIADFGTKDVVESIDNLGKTLFLWIVRFA